MDHSSSKKDKHNTERPHKNCSICGSLRDREYSCFKFERTADDHLPAAVECLVVIEEEMGTDRGRIQQLRQCPECGTKYRFQTDYEYDVVGYIHEEWLLRLGPEKLQDDFHEPEEKKSESNAPQPVKELSSPSKECLSLVRLNNAQLQTVLDMFHPFLSARNRYKMELGWSCDISIPRATLQASRQKMIDAWSPLLEILKELNLDSISFSEIQLPKQFDGGRRRFEELLKWLENDEHRINPTTL